MTENSIKTIKHPTDHLKEYQWKPGQTGNPGGRPKDTLKQYMAKKLIGMSEEEKEDYLKGIHKLDKWKMAEGNFPQETDVTSGGQPIEFTVNLTDKNTNGDNTSRKTINSDEGQPSL